MTSTANDARPLAFGLYYFGNDDAHASPGDQRRLILESARFADEHDFSAVWSPERHLHSAGCRPTRR